MKRTIYIALALLLFLLLDATAIAQNSQETSSDEDCTAKPEACVQVNYDRFKDRTTVVTRPFILSDQLKFWNTLSLIVGYSSSGKEITRPSEGGFIFNVTFADVRNGDQPAFANSKSVYLLIDGKSYSLGDVSLKRYNDEPVQQKWSYGLLVPFEILELIDSAKEVEMRAGSVEFKFDDNVKAAFHRLVELVPKESAVIPKKEDVAPKVKTPAPKPVPHRRRGRP